ncbi:hypothetical protein Syun_019078 [Stephania yunnanensis]|uniref:Uncharacterized protein n=1 Tax=Stephania yunnanensis TaxID=152371 RepID=A0AAP0ITG4_9MAGN
MKGATGEDAGGPDDVLEEENEVNHSSGETDNETTPEVEKKKKVTGDELLAESTNASALIMAEEISKATLGISDTITAERDLQKLVLAAMDEVLELWHVEKAIYAVKIMGRNELMEAFMSLSIPYRIEWPCHV